MKYPTACAIIAAGALIALAVFESAPRYSLLHADVGGLFRLDRMTGELALCYSELPPAPEHWTCHATRPRD